VKQIGHPSRLNECGNNGREQQEKSKSFATNVESLGPELGICRAQTGRLLVIRLPRPRGGGRERSRDQPNGGRHDPGAKGGTGVRRDRRRYCHPKGVAEKKKHFRSTVKWEAKGAASNKQFKVRRPDRAQA